MCKGLTISSLDECYDAAKNLLKTILEDVNNVNANKVINYLQNKSYSEDSEGFNFMIGLIEDETKFY